MRVEILKKQVKETFPSTPLLDYALQVEKITTSKVRNLSSSPRSVLYNISYKADYCTCFVVFF